MESGRALPSAEKLRDIWNHLCGTLPKCLEIGEERRRRAHQRLNDRSLEEWARVVDRIAASGFCNGENDRGWVATFDWLLRPDTAAKVLEGKYDNRGKRPPTRTMQAITNWQDECAEIHGGRCTNAEFHDAVKQRDQDDLKGLAHHAPRSLVQPFLKEQLG